MKKLIANYKFIQKIFLSIMIVVMLSFAVPVRSQAGIGGLLLDPLFDLIGTVADVVCGALQAFLVDGEFNNSDNSSGLNFYLADTDDFMKKTTEGSAEYDENYAEFKYNPNASVKKEFQADELDKSIWGNSTYAIPMLRYTPEKIFSGRIPALDINFVNPTDWTQKTDENGNPLYGNADEMNQRSIARALHETIASWYVSLRNLCIVGLMLVLLYVGIRIVISSTASDKSKYKQMLMDWLVALCIVFCLHYIMTFTTAIVNEISQTIAGNVEQNGNNIAVQVKDGDEVDAEFNTDLMGLIRFQMQYNTVGSKLLYLIFYIAMVIYTCMFTFYYLKRVLTMAFLTLISPLVALTYPIDKLRDGKAQAFDMWLKEYVFNALVQPFHLIIYSIFVGSAVELAADNPLFAIVALAFITPAEKILRRFFGFDKAGTAGALGAVAGIAGGAAVISGFKSLMAPRKDGGGKTNSGIKTKQRLEGDIQDLGKNNPTGLVGNTVEMKDSSIRQAEQSSQVLSSSGGKTKNGADTLPEVASTAGMSQNSDGLWLPNSTLSSTSTSSPSTSNQHGSGALAWTDDDTRGVGGYGLDALKHGVASTGAGQRAIRLGRSIKNKAISVRDMANARKENIATKWNELPKPIRNTARTIGNVAKGVGNVALQTGKIAGKAAVKAAPGAMIGLAAGIAGDELGDMWKYTLAGAAISSTIGSSAVTQAGSFVADSYRTVASGNDTNIIARQEKEYVKSKEWDDMYRHEFKSADGSELSRAELKAKKQQGAFYDSRGIQGEDVIKAVKLEDKIKREIGQDNENFSAQDYTARIMKIAKPYTADKLRKEAEVQSLTNSITKEIMKGGLDRNSAKEQAQIAVKYIKQAKGIKE